MRDVLCLTGTHLGCDNSICGDYTIHANKQPVKSYTMFAVDADGCEITSIEGLVNEEIHGLQFGFCPRH